MHMHYDCTTLYDHWLFPKGHVEGKESLVTTAIREIKEETGYLDFTQVVGYLYEISYKFKQGNIINYKNITYYIFQLKSKQKKKGEYKGKWVSIEKIDSFLKHTELKQLTENFSKDLPNIMNNLNKLVVKRN